jgi:hypothetical protein
MSTDAEKNAVEKMKLAALQGTPGPPIEPEGPLLVPHAEAEIRLPPHRRILKVEDVNEELPPKKKIPAQQLARIIFKTSTGEDSADANLSMGEVRAVLHQLTVLNQEIENWQRAASQAEECLQAIKAGGVMQHQVVDALAALKQARQG